MSYFASPRVDLHVAAHEAVHQLQHRGETKDAGLGSERHANAVADAVVRHRSPKRLLGPAGRAVPSALRGYVQTDDKGNPDASGLVRVSDTGQTWTKSSKKAYVDRKLVTEANAILRGISSAISLEVGSDTLDIPNGLDRPLYRLKVNFANGAWDDCGRMARDIMGRSGQDEPAKAVVSPGGIPGQIPAIKFGTKSPEEQFALTIAMDEAMNKPGLSRAQKIAAGTKVLEDYSSIYSMKGSNWIRKTAGKSLGAKDDRRLKIDEHAIPEIGEAYAIVGGNASGGGYSYHWAAVIIAVGGDRIVLEASADASDYSAKDPDWKFETYGTRDPAQTFHAQTVGSSPSRWGKAHTLRMRTTDMLPEVEARLRSKTARIAVTVNRAIESSGEDDIYVVLRSGSHFPYTLDGGDTAVGQTRNFDKTLRSFWPPGDSIRLQVFEEDWGFDRVVGTIDWPFPFRDQSAKLTGHGADYTVKVGLH